MIQHVKRSTHFLIDSLFVIVFAQNTQDVVNAVRWSLHNNVPIRVRSGGHNYEGLSVLDGGIVIDVSEINQIKIDPTSKTVTVGAGCKISI